jgi:hypothetical protein
VSGKTPRIKAVAAEGPSTLIVTWKDGGTDSINLAGWIARGDDLFVPLKDRKVFEAPRIIDYGAAVAWDEDEELTIDTIQLELLAQEQRPFRSKDLADWQKAMGLSDQEAAELLGVSNAMWFAYKMGSKPIPVTVAMICRAARRDPIFMHAHYRPRRTGRSKKSA